MHYAFTVLLALGLLGTAHASDTPIEDYHYGQALDIAQVLRVKTDTSKHCGPVEARMTYRDSKGVERVLRYRTLADACSTQN